MKLIIKISGKACQVFELINLLAKYYGKETLGDILGEAENG